MFYDILRANKIMVTFSNSFSELPPYTSSEALHRDILRARWLPDGSLAAPSHSLVSSTVQSIVSDPPLPREVGTAKGKMRIGEIVQN